MADKENNHGLSSEDATVVENVSSTQDAHHGAAEQTNFDDELLDDVDDDENLDDEELTSLKSKVLKFLQEKVPFLYTLYLKISKQEISEENEDLGDDADAEINDEVDDIADEADQGDGAKQGLAEKVDATIKSIKDHLLNKMPFLEKFASKKKNKQPRKKILSQKMTYLIFFGLIAWLLFDEGFNPQNEQTIKPQKPTTAQVAEQLNQPSNTEEKPIPSPSEDVDPQQPPHEVTTSENSDIPITTDVETLPVEISTATVETTSEENVVSNTLDTEQASVETTTATEETVIENNTSPVAVVIGADPVVAQETPPATVTTPPDSLKDAENNLDTKVNQISQNPQFSEDTPGHDPISSAIEPQPGKVEIEKTKDLDTEIRDIIEKVEEKYADKEDYESAPDYTKVGRGLVYNCKNKHWSCLNRTNYHQCRKNQIFFTKLKELPECVVFDVYYSDEDCQIKQADMINKLIPVPACTQL